jgi:hypothetical protein
MELTASLFCLSITLGFLKIVQISYNLLPKKQQNDYMYAYVLFVKLWERRFQPDTYRFSKEGFQHYILFKHRLDLVLNCHRNNTL